MSGSSSPTQDPGVQQTQVALGIVATSYAIDQTESAVKQAATPVPQQSGPSADQLQATEMSMQFQATEMSMQFTQQALQQPTQANATYTPYPTYTPAAGTPTPDVASQIKKAKVLLFEDSVGLGYWIEDTLRKMGIEDYRQTTDYSGDFMAELNSGKKWDLIIVGAEAKTKIQGDFWDQIVDQSNRKVAVIAEVWYMDLLGGGKMRNFTSQCGVGYASNLPLADSIYWWESTNPVFTTPNEALPLLHYSRYWTDQAGDKMRITSGGDAKMLAGYTSARKSDSSGAIASCMGGRTIIQTFSNHDYHKGDIMNLWENYITYVLTNHFEATAK
jgi:hypothetical protein